MLNTTDHSRDSAGLTYVYPVVSRRAGGISVGINLNPNNACNWQCIYCQVPGLSRGTAPEIDLEKLKIELNQMLGQLQNGEFFKNYPVEPQYQVLRDIAISGNGEPTTARVFAQVIDVIHESMLRFSLVGKINLVLITNGSQMDKAGVRAGIEKLAACGGEIWFKLDSATSEGMKRINGTAISPAKVRENLLRALQFCPVWIQHCCFSIDQQEPGVEEQNAFLEFVSAIFPHENLRGVLLYGLARPSEQPEAPRLGHVDLTFFEHFAYQLGQLGVPVRVNP